MEEQTRTLFRKPSSIKANHRKLHNLLVEIFDQNLVKFYPKTKHSKTIQITINQDYVSVDGIKLKK